MLLQVARLEDKCHHVVHQFDAIPRLCSPHFGTVDSLLAPFVSLCALFIAQALLPDSKHPWFTPVENTGVDEERRKTSSRCLPPPRSCKGDEVSEL